MDTDHKTIKQRILDHCSATGLSFNDFRAVYASQIIDDPGSFDRFFKAPFNDISKSEKAARVDLLMDILVYGLPRD